MTVVTDSKKRVTLPFAPGVRFDLQTIGQQKIILTRLEPVPSSPSKVTFRKKNGRTIGSIGRAVSAAALQAALAELP